MKTGLVLEGGAMRGMYTAGVLDVFLENGVSFDEVIGVSAGAIAGVSFVSGQKGRTIRYNLKYCRDKRVMSFYSLLTTGDLVGNQFCYHEIPERLDPFDNQAFQASPTKFFATCANLETGEAEYIHLTDMNAQIDYLRASASMPLASNVVEAEGRWMLDGGIVDAIPLKFAEEKFHKNVVVLTQPIDYIKKKNKAMPLIRNRMKQYPKVVAAMARRHEVYNRQVAYTRYRERAGKAFVLRPEAPLALSRTERDPEKLQRAYDHGRMVAEKRMAALKEFLHTGGTPNEE